MEEMSVYYFNILNLALLKTSFQGNRSPGKSPSVPCSNKQKSDQSLSGSADSLHGAHLRRSGVTGSLVTDEKLHQPDDSVTIKWFLRSGSFPGTLENCTWFLGARTDSLRSFRPKPLFPCHLLLGSTDKYSFWVPTWHCGVRGGYLISNQLTSKQIPKGT